jgi:multidrug efflux pump subunit AcrB
VVTRKTTPDFLMVVNLQSPDGSLNRDYLSNYALTQVRDRLARIDGVATSAWSGRATMPCASGSIRAGLPNST